MNPNHRNGGWMATQSGKAFWPLDPRPEDICIEDIAHALSMICRFGGHVSRFYSVAEHSVFVSTIVPQEHALTALMHDATEAYMSDLIMPIKECMPGYKDAEDRLWRVIAVKFGLPNEMPPCVKQADISMLLAERRDLKPNGPDRPWIVDGIGIEPACMNVLGLPPGDASKWFMERFQFLTNTKLK